MARAAIAIVVFLSLFAAAIHASPETSNTERDDAFATFEPRPTEEAWIDASLIPVVRGFPRTGLRLTDEPQFRRGCRHGRRFGRRRIVPFGEGAVVHAEDLRRFHVGLGRGGPRRFDRPRAELGREMAEISLSDLMKQIQLGAPREFRHRPREHGGFPWNYLHRR